MENTVIKDAILDKKLGEYGCNEDNFIARGEITVTITLKEYRDLVTTSATASARIREAEHERFEQRQIAEKLKEENCQLKSELYEIKKAPFEEGEEK